MPVVWPSQWQKLIQQRATATTPMPAAVAAPTTAGAKLRLLARYALFAATAACLTGHATPAHAFLDTAWNYVKQYQIGLDYTSSYDSVAATYDTEQPGAAAEDCKVLADEVPAKQRCQVNMTGGGSSGVGVFLQQAFKRQGLFYVRADIGFGARYLAGELDEKEQEVATSRSRPLHKMRFSLGALVVKPYVQFGITPATTWPDILVSLGPVAQISMGKVRVNEETENAVLATTSGRNPVLGFLELEIVFWRFGDGALSVFQSKDFSGSDEGGAFYRKKVDGMDNIRANFARSVGGDVFGLGLKFLLNWP